MPEGLPKPEVDITTAGPMTLGRLGISFAVGLNGEVLRYPDGEPIDGGRVEQVVAGSGRTLTNTQAAERIIASRAFVDAVSGKLAELRTVEVIAEEEK